MIKIGSYNDLLVERRVEFGFYLRATEGEVLLPAKYVPENTQLGDRIRVFIYTDSEDRPIATTLKPKAVVGEFAYLAVKDVTPIGVFLDWGLEKDLFLPKNQQPGRMMVGREYVVKVLLDEITQRVYASAQVARNCRAVAGELKVGQKVNLLVYRDTPIGMMAVIDHTYSGMLNKSDIYETLAVGDTREGYVSRIHPDGKIDLALKKTGYRSITDSSHTVLEALKAGGGFLPCNDKSPPEEIRRMFAMSKKEFKRAVGGLYKKGAIQLTDKGIKLKP